MTTPSQSSLRRLVAAALTAPSGDNCQPFTFRWDGRVLDLCFDAQRARHRLDAGYHGSLIALGAALEAMDIAASAEGLALEHELLGPDAPGPHGSWLRVRPRPAARQRDPLLDGLFDRGTDRRRYRGGDPGDPVFARIASDAQALDGVGFHLVGRPDRALRRFVLSCDAILWKDSRCMKDAIQWLRVDDEEVRRTRDGVSWRSAGISRPEAAVSRLMRARPALIDAAARAGAPHFTRQLLRAQLASSGALGLISTDLPRPHGPFQVGRLVLRSWVDLGLAGYGLQPLTLASLCVYNLRQDVLPDDLDPRLRQLLAQGDPVVQRAFGLRSQDGPMWMFRTGRSPALPSAARTLRLRVDQVLVDASA